MPIQCIQKNHSIRQRCIACGESRTIAFEQLEVGLLDEHIEATATSVIALPACSICGSVEYLVGSAEGSPGHPHPGSYGHLHRLLVDQLHSELVDGGGDADDGPRPARTVRQPTADEMARWFPHGLVLADDSVGDE